MKLQKQPNNWSCLPTAFAMVAHIPVSQFIEAIGHDGSDIIAPEYSDPYCRRSFHIQEINDVCLAHNLSVTPIEVNPQGCVAGDRIINFNIGGLKRVEKYMKKYRCVLIGSGFPTYKPHAVAWNRLYIYDPNFSIYEYDSRLFKIEIAYIIF